METRTSSRADRKILLTGGAGGMAQALKTKLAGSCRLHAPDRHELDVAEETAVEAYFLEQGPFDAVINNAGCIHPAAVKDSVTADWIRDIRVNLIGAYLVSRMALRQNPGALIINIASTAAYAAYAEWSSYCASKAGLVTLTKSMAREGARAFAIAAGATDTKFRDGLGLSAANLMPPAQVAETIVDILDEKYKPGDVLFVRRNEFKIL
jgi:NAD(P)-dependent dehydrogenase (short-subunit alcohol dehydrogenase family)